MQKRMALLAALCAALLMLTACSETGGDFFTRTVISVAVKPLPAGQGMHIRLLEDLDGLGKKGDDVWIREGYARNFLIARGLAEPWDKSPADEQTSKDESEAFHREQELERLRNTASSLDGKTVEVTLKTDAYGKPLGAVTAKAVAEAIRQKYDVDVDKHGIIMPEIKKAGTYSVTVDFGSDIKAAMQLIVTE